ncbi:hypothetical protein FK220_012220 [Flavobacteriaceae bacterium TP-CH-4]|uniref:Uncharacterized protein n=1 Tax=Pelagihabitans pacificus TaxID=2696054 RepID=A0A967AU90_9FLAO|nr:hypothetical protein [Pelagihabitans pacificus]NHF60114.1 hypothetical protein [Pelagihabitans pacificus]
MRIVTIAFFVLLIFACGNEASYIRIQKKIAFEKINYFKFPTDSLSKPFQYRVTYYFSNGIPHRWLELDSTGKVLTDYIYDYDDDWIHSGAKYREDGATEYSLEKVRFENDSTQITEWLDSIGQVYYTMTDNLNQFGKTYRATFEGDKVHGYDSTFYTKDGFQKQIFFTNVKGKVFNGRTFEYDSVNTNIDWVVRKKIVEDTIREIHFREVYYDSSFVSKNGVFYEGVLSTGTFSENSISFTKNEDVLFQTRTADWDNQFGFLSYKNNGVFGESVPLKILDTIYNGAISPLGDKIIYSTKKNVSEKIMLLKKNNGSWSEKIDLTQSSDIEGGYFYWRTENELYFYTPENSGDIVQGKLVNDQLIVTDYLKSLNTSSGTEFSPYVDKEKRFIIFTRYLEGDEAQQGFFISYNSADFDSPNWSKPKKLDMLPYGWNAYILSSGKQFLYSNGDDILSVPLKNSKLQIGN